MKKLILEEWLLNWLEYRRPYVKESTYGNYSTIIVNYLIPYLGKSELSELTEGVVQKFVIELLRNGKRKGGGLSEKTVRDILNILIESLKRAKKEGLIDRVDYDIVFPSGLKKRQIKVLSSPEQKKLAEYVSQNPNSRNIGILFCLQTGLRVGEICALQWRDLNLDEGIVEITKTLQRVYVKKDTVNSYSYITVTTPKSASSVRSIPLTSIVQSLLLRLCQEEPVNPSCYLLTGNSSYIEPRTYSSYYKQFMQNAGIGYINFHGLRHTFATELIRKGADYKTVSALLGHKSITTTLNLYVHPQMEIKRKCIGLLEME